jgi:hypothetical protein
VTATVLPSLRVRGGSGRMGDDNRRSEHPICNNANEQKDGDHDRRNEVFHDPSLCRRAGSEASINITSPLLAPMCHQPSP